ncbi:unnamed protein product [Prunus armeniaca]|uniref:Endonuclease/exonuclease/phosphatase domain-containing protein n=1 Tax=Prunus armeniaca TaxID=36596 RepID=A0A6J5XN54_PRUAR|nr:unnamed protein product [Prunus armeniaca]
MNRHRLNQIRRQCGFYRSFVVDPVGTAGGLCLWWKPWVEVEILDWSKNWIDTRVKSDTDHIFGRFTWLYGTPYNAEKTAFWEGTHEWDKGDQIPWIVSGDMNEVLWNFEKQGGVPWNPRRRRYLLEFMESNSLIDLGFSGQCFTWEKKCTDNVVVRERLDRSLGNADWVLCWPNTQISHGLRVGPDHVPLIIDNSPSPGKRNKVLRFEASWAEDPDCKELIGGYWSGNIEGSGNLVWHHKLMTCKMKLIQWRCDIMGGNNKQKIQARLRELERLHMAWASDNTLQQQEAINADLEKLWKAEELYWCQRSRVNWLSAGDKNTRFFHLSTIQRRQRNKVLRLKNERGCWLSGDKLIGAEFNLYFSRMFISVGNRNWGTFLDCIPETVNADMNALLVASFSEEISIAAHQLGSLKSPGPDGFPSLFLSQILARSEGDAAQATKVSNENLE